MSISPQPRHYDKVNNKYIEELRREYRYKKSKKLIRELPANPYDRFLPEEMRIRSRNYFGSDFAASEYDYIEMKLGEEYIRAKKMLESVGENTPAEKVRSVYSNVYNRILELANNYVHIPSMVWLGHFTEEALNDLEKAAEWYEKAYSYDSAEGARCYADMLMAGRGVKKNVKKALDAYDFAANHGSKEAAFVMGEHYRNEGDIDKAKEYYGLSAELGFKPAKARLEQLKSEGGRNEEKSSVERWKW